MILSGIWAKAMPVISLTALRGNPNGSHVFQGSLESAHPAFRSVLFMLNRFSPKGVIGGTTPPRASRSPVHTPVTSRLGGGPPVPASFNLSYKLLVPPANLSYELLFPPAPAWPITIGAKIHAAMRPKMSLAIRFRIRTSSSGGREFSQKVATIIDPKRDDDWPPTDAIFAYE